MSSCIFTAVIGNDGNIVILTFDIEDWFHTHHNRKYYSGHIWEQLPTRVEKNTEKILDLLGEYDRKATFFILGWVAEKHPDLVKKIASKGHEIGAHSTWHHNAALLSIGDFETDLKRNLNILEDLTGEKVLSYRAPGYSLRLTDNEYFDVLTKNGIINDSSLQIKDFPNSYPFEIETSNGILQEFPLIKSFYGFPYSGGGYLRTLPLKTINKYFKQNSVNMLYLHPRDIDTDNPSSNLFSIFRNWFNNFNTSSSLIKLRFILEHYKSTTIGRFNNKDNGSA